MTHREALVAVAEEKIASAMEDIPQKLRTGEYPRRLKGLIPILSHGSLAVSLHSDASRHCFFVDMLTDLSRYPWRF